MDSLRLQQTVVVFGEAVCMPRSNTSNGKKTFLYDPFAVRLGEFHTCMSFLSAEDGGLKVFSN